MRIIHENGKVHAIQQDQGGKKYHSIGNSEPDAIMSLVDQMARDARIAEINRRLSKSSRLISAATPTAKKAFEGALDAFSKLSRSMSKVEPHFPMLTPPKPIQKKRCQAKGCGAPAHSLIKSPDGAMVCHDCFLVRLGFWQECDVQ